MRSAVHALSPLAALLALAFTALPALAQSADTQELERVTVTLGRGQIRSVQGLTKADFEAAAAAGQSPLATVSRLPGVNFQSADPLGNYEWSTRFTVRAFSQNQLGFTLDGVPLGDMSYGNLNGLHISRAISSENVARADLSQGTGSLDTPSSSNLGGTLQFYSIDPAKAFGLQLSQTLGSDSNRRTFVRLDSGQSELGAIYASYTHQQADKWRGQGQQRQDQFNLKYVKDFGETRLSAFVNTSNRREVDYQDMSLEMVNRLGYNWDNYYPDFNTALQSAKGIWTHGETSVDDAYYAGSGLRKDTLAGVTLDTKLAEGLRLKTTVYHHKNDGRGLWFTPYTASPDGTPIALRTTEYGIKRDGLTATLDYEIGIHQLRASLWHENNDFDQARRFYAVSANAIPDVYSFPSNPFQTAWQYAFNTKTDQFSLSDTIAIAKDLTLGAGFKSLRAKIDGNLQLGSGHPNGSITASKGFLPQVGLNYQLSRSDELFTSVSRNMRAYQGAGTGTTPFATTQAGFDAIKGSLHPETSDNFEAGWRTSSKLYEAAVTAYLVNFKDRLLGVTQGSGIQGNPTVLSNVGGVRTKGLEAALSLRLMPGVSWYNSLSLSNSTYQDNVTSKDASNNTVTVATAGKHVVDAPDQMVKSILSYDDGHWFGNFGADYMSKRYYSYLNDAAVSGRTLFNLSGGLRAKSLGFLAEGSVQLGVTNLTDRKYISTVGSNGFGNSGDSQTLLTGAPRQFFVTFTGKL
ncbi:TonB-dependent receptor [Roseateles saccharophilus]|uniref:Iron complex outermembrane receptor protein n=1 Tax=Roseateles saccharophilus TaxID=304 RepID=A0A4R3VKP9_ROSSA|nr:TonB-dependent receptor [Roseateles saccharophilus]MDG0831362.1 TonB-dependent receptor [Roseateles saccharophilus]TCV04492.1 iron complex outermembrane receptor protein [Roseateles saccharophilus]